MGLSDAPYHPRPGSRCEKLLTELARSDEELDSAALAARAGIAPPSVIHSLLCLALARGIVEKRLHEGRTLWRRGNGIEHLGLAIDDDDERPAMEARQLRTRATPADLEAVKAKLAEASPMLCWRPTAGFDPIALDQPQEEVAVLPTSAPVSVPKLNAGQEPAAAPAPNHNALEDLAKLCGVPVEHVRRMPQPFRAAMWDDGSLMVQRGDWTGPITFTPDEVRQLAQLLARFPEVAR